MAVSLTSHHAIHHYYRPPFSFSKPSINLESKTLIAFQTHSHNHFCKSVLPSFSNCSPVHSRRSFKSSLAVNDSSIKTIDGEISNSQKKLPRLKTLFQVYKDAILDDDEQTLSKIDAMVYVMEKEKNEVDDKMSALSAEITSGKERYTRLQADFDNFRKRSEKEKLTIRIDAQGEVIESLLPMVDNFERAKQQLKPETEMEKKIDTSYQGIYKQFVEIMRSLRVGVVATVGKPFDPSLHEAISREESTEFREGIIVQEFRRGFLLGGRLLRPAMVKVSAGPGKKRVTIATENFTEQPATLDER